MKINYLSDLHIEFGHLMHELEGEVLVLAGDIDVRCSVAWINEAAKYFEHVVYVLGNHEYYNRRIDKVERILRETLASNVHLLQNESVEINGVTFHGSTLWTDFDKGNIMAVMEAKLHMCDFKNIKYKNSTGDYHKFQPKNAMYEHLIAKQYLTDNVSEGDVVVTHMAPTWNSIHERFRGQKLNGAFASDLSELILDTKPVLWFHGHTHDSFDYMVGDTRVLCNPRGYVGEELNPDFDLEASVEVHPFCGTPECCQQC